ncbi:hypothetical protein FKP32DRAFT_1682287 [Trametes sanguinea]|nr:hypothetical protein FKP32DRAFT_1682287 [Trametes sanguinea]
MPERAEILVQHSHIQHFISSTPPSDRRLQALWVDPTAEEQASAPVRSAARAGLVYRLPPGATLRRGQKQSRSPAKSSKPVPAGRRRRVASNVQDVEKGFAVYPYWLAHDLASSTYCLVRSHFNPQALILEFKDQDDNSLFVDIRLYLHVSAQIFTLSEWTTSICPVPRNVRGFKVAIAFDLGPYILALLSHDLLFNIRWATSLSRLPSAHVSDVMMNWPEFLRDIAWWIQRRRERARSRDGPAFLAVHSSEVFPGLGNYTLSEVFHRAEQEVFDNASRTARLCAAYRSFADHCEARLWTHVKRYLHGFKFAVERSDRLFFQHFLQVYGKQLTWVGARHGALLDEAIRAARGGGTFTYDVFEPGLVASAIMMRTYNIGHLIFGRRDWDLLRTEWMIEVDTQDGTPDALTALYKAFMWRQKTHHPPATYYSADGLRGGNTRARRFQTTMYRLSPSPSFQKSSPGVQGQDLDDDLEPRKKRTFQAWSVIPINLSQCSTKVRDHLVPVTEKVRQASTLAAKITSSRTYTVGPMDFCGIARVERAQGKGDPM